MSRQRTGNWVLCLILIAMGITVVIGVGRWIAGRGSDQGRVASAELVSHFNVAVASLDVDESERAVAALDAAIALARDEPALWANMAIARTRLNQPEVAAEALEKAQSLTAESEPEMALLSAELLGHAGKIEESIGMYRQVHQLQPSNLATTYALSELLGRLSQPDADTERLELLRELSERDPGNLRVLTEWGRVAASLERADDLRHAIEELKKVATDWPNDLREQLASAEKSVAEGDLRHASIALTFVDNLLKPRADYAASLARLGVDPSRAIGTPIRRFMVLSSPAPQVASPDSTTNFELKAIEETAARPALVLAWDGIGERSSTLLSLVDNQIHVGESAALRFPGAAAGATTSSIARVDLDGDFLLDFVAVGSEGLEAWKQNPDGQFEPLNSIEWSEGRKMRHVWSHDVDADGDMDLLLSDGEGTLVWMVNDGKGKLTTGETGLQATGVVGLCVGDIDDDGDMDVVTLGNDGEVMAWRNLRNGRYLSSIVDFNVAVKAIVIGDVSDADRLEIVALREQGSIAFASWLEGNKWRLGEIKENVARQSSSKSGGQDSQIIIADFDNNGRQDIASSLEGVTTVWLHGEGDEWPVATTVMPFQMTSTADMDGDGLVDLVGLSEGVATVATNSGEAGYGHYVMMPRANPNPGDKRINTFGMGGSVTLRAGVHSDRVLIDSPVVRFGLGENKSADLAWIVWPNGTTQVEYQPSDGEELTIQQRLKGSCPWIFTHDGRGFQFVKDFLWRSPLGLRINAQTTAGVTQTEDWVGLDGAMMAAIDGRYQIRITAELWETHFVDHVRLLVVDHPEDTVAMLDERFVPTRPPGNEIYIVEPPRAFASVVDHRGHDVSDAIQQRDTQYVSDFVLSGYQGVAEDHWVTFELPEDATQFEEVLLLGHGWIYPTDSSLNVAIAQDQSTSPYGLILEQAQEDGSWRTIDDQLGFPAGKNKDVVIPLVREVIEQGRKFRLRTNMEVYWDWLRWSVRTGEAKADVKEAKRIHSELTFRGYSKLRPNDRRRPETPIYEVQSTATRWFDLEGFHTRFGDVEALLASIDDRYVIMNAGDELRLEFEAIGEPASGYRRDFILVGDGWVKDGDFNTAFSATVQPLPSHGVVEYEGPLGSLEEDPVYQRNRDDWRSYHTRYVSPRRTLARPVLSRGWELHERDKSERGSARNDLVENKGE